MELLTRNFTAQSVALATDTTAKEIANWADRGLIVGQQEPLGKGHKRSFTWNNVMEIGGAVALMQIGVNSPADAFAASQRFAHMAAGRAGYVGDKETSVPRLPGLPFHYRAGETYLCVSGDKSATLLVSDGKLPLSIVEKRLQDPAGLILLNVTTLFSQIIGRMAMSPAEVLDEAYPETMAD
jgi:hypothetical protein